MKTNRIQAGFIITIFIFFLLILKEIKMKTFLQSPKTSRTPGLQLLLVERAAGLRGPTRPGPRWRGASGQENREGALRPSL